MGKKEGTNERRKKKAPMTDGGRIGSEWENVQNPPRGGKAPSFHAQQSRESVPTPKWNSGNHPITHKTRPQKSSIVQQDKAVAAAAVAVICILTTDEKKKRKKIVKCTFLRR